MTAAEGSEPVDVVRRLLTGSERFAVTGATGWFGRTALELLCRALGSSRFSSAVSAYAGTARDLVLDDGTVVAVRPLGELVGRRDVTHVLHFAFLTRDHIDKLGLEAYLAANLRITDLMLDVVAEGPVQGFAYASSGAVHGAPGGGATSLRDNPYGRLKRMDELLFRQTCADVGAVSCISRVFSVSGRYMSKPGLYALGDFVSRATQGKALEVRAAARVVRSYCAVEDVVTLQLAGTLGSSQESVDFETGGEEVEVGELAYRVREALALPHLPVVRMVDPPTGPDERYVGDHSKMDALAQECGLRLSTLDEQIVETAAWVAETVGTTVPVVSR